MANENGWGDGSVNNAIGWGQGANNAISWGKSHLDSWSGATDIDGGNAPINTVAPALSGTAQEGQTLTCSTGTWSGSPTYAYQWKRNGNNIGSATNSTYTLVTADVGQSIKCMVTATNFSGSANADSNTVTPTSSVDADAQAFITAAGITDPTQQSAINQLVVDLKSYGIWNDLPAIYPVIGGTATTHKWNLKDPRDLNAAYRLTFSTGWTHSSTGMTPNGVSAFANSNLTPSTAMPSGGDSLHYYSRTNSNITGDTLIGGELSAPYRALILRGKDSGGIGSYFTTNPSSAYQSASQTDAGRDARGLFSGSSDSSNTYFYLKGIQLANNTTAQTYTARYSNVLYIGARRPNTGSPVVYTDKECAFAAIGKEMTTTKLTNLHTIVQNYQTTLGRQV